MVRQRTEHLTHTEPVSAGASETAVAILHRHLERSAGILQLRIIGAFAQARQHADAGIGDDDLEGSSHRRIRHQARFRPATVAKDIVLQLTHRPDNPGRDWLRETRSHRGLLGPARPQRPLITAVAFGIVSPQRERADPCSKLVAENLAARERRLDRDCETGQQGDPRELHRIGAPGHENFDQWADPARARHSHGTKTFQSAGLGRPQEIVGAGEIADQLPTSLLRIAHLGPLAVPRRAADPSIDSGCRIRPLVALHNRSASKRAPRLRMRGVSAARSSVSSPVCDHVATCREEASAASICRCRASGCAMSWEVR